MSTAFDVRLAELDNKWEKKFLEVEGQRDDRVAALESAAAAFDGWKPQIESAVESVRMEVGKLTKHWERSVKEKSVADPGLIPQPSATSGRFASVDDNNSPDGHRVDTSLRDRGFGSVLTNTHVPAKGTSDPPFPEPKFHRVHEQSGFRTSSSSSQSSSMGKLPKLPFPVFSGPNPKLWLSRCESYFEMYQLEPSMWIPVATMPFDDAAARWFQSVEHRLKYASWSEFATALLDRFGRDQKELLIRQLFHIRQTQSVSEYVDQFAQLVDQLTAYGHVTEPIYYAMRFVDGLKDEIRSVVSLHRPSTFDTAASLALLQEEVSSKHREYKKPEFAAMTKNFPRGPHPLPVPPLLDKQPLTVLPEEKKLCEGKSPEEKMAALRAYRRAKGLCVRCAGKWSREHKCAPTVQLHVVQELLELFSLEDSEDGQTITEPQEQLFLALSKEAVTGVEGPRTMKLQGRIQDQDILVLVDSGSSHTFISQSVASGLLQVQQLPVPVRVQVANGSSLQCTAFSPQAMWHVGDCHFSSDLKILPLPHFDMILGMDWLESFSPMKIHWKQKWMVIPYEGTTALLQGLLPAQTEEILVQVCSLLDSESDSTEAPHPAITKLLGDFESVFRPLTELPPERQCDHSIPLINGAKPVHIRPYRYAPALKDEIEKQIAEMLHKGIIQPNISAFSSPVLLVRKKDGSWRFCVDYRYLNALTLKSRFPIPVFDELMDELAAAKWFSSLDLNSGYHQIRLKKGEEFKTAFQTHFGHFEFRVMAFGLCGAPGTFQGAMNTTLAPLLRKCVLLFFDDILIYSSTFEEHLLHLSQVLELLAKDNWIVKLSKCSFAQQSITYLGHIISAEGISTDPAKVEAIRTWPQPETVKELRSFLGLAGYYRKFVKHFAIITKPLTNLLRKQVLFVWTEEHTTAFNLLKQALMTAPVLAKPDFTKPFCLETDASNTGVGAVLLQEGHPLAFISKPLGPKTSGLSTYEKEYMAILLAVDQWRQYLQHAEFVIFTDQKSLIHLNEQRLNTPWQQKVFSKLLGLQYRIEYKKGIDNSAADALSRRVHMQSQCSSMSIIQPAWLTEVLASYEHDDFATALIAKLALDPAAVPSFTLRDGILRYNNRIWVGADTALQHKLLTAFHTSPLGGHSGVPVTISRVKKYFAWRNLKSSVHKFVQSCQTCQQAKPDRAKYPGLLQPLPVPDGAWKVVSLDFVEGLPMSHGMNTILVVVDKFSKYSHFIPIRHPFSAASIASVYMMNIYKLHGMPEALISDRDRIFTSKLWQELFQKASVQLKMSTAYHPQTDGQTERVNQCMETFLRCFVHACPHQWFSWIHLAEFWYNTSWHSALNHSPFEVLYGHSPRVFGIAAGDACQTMNLEDWLQQRELMTNLVKLHLARAQERMKRQADQNRSERQFSVGDMVFLKLQPYIQSSVAVRANQKLAFKFFGPFKVIEKIGAVAYKLLLPDSSSIHPVFHVSQLKRAVPESTQVTSQLPDLSDCVQVPVQVLNKRLSVDGQTMEVLIKWSRMPSSLATWESLEDLKRRFPYAPAWGQAGSFGGGGVSAPHADDSLEAVEQDGPRRAVRAKRPSTRVIGEEWTK